MPPYTAAASARPPQSKSDRPTSATSRIIPAVPLAFSRPPRASHPVTATATATGHGNTPAQSETPKLGVVVNGSEAENKSDAAAAEEPTTSGLEHHTPTMKERHDVGTAEQGVASGTDNGLVTPGDAQDQTPFPSSGSNSQVLSQNPAPGVPLQASLDPEQQSWQESAGTASREHSHEIPSPFHPSENLSTPTSAMSSSFPPPQQPQPHSHPLTMHQPRPSAGSLVFGGFADSSSPSPVPLPPAGFSPYPHPGFVPTNFGVPPLPPPAHAQYIAEQHPSMFYPPMHMSSPGAHGYKHPPPPHSARPQHWFHPDGHIPYPMGPPGQAAAQNGPPYTNGEMHTPRSLSQASSKTHDHDVRAQNQDATHAAPAARSDHQLLATDQNEYGVSTPSKQELPLRVEDDSAVALREYLCMHFGNRDFTDYVLELFHVRTERPICVVPVHGVVVARSPALLSLIVSHAQNSNYTDRSLKVLRISSSDHFLDPYSFTEALRYLYGGPLLDPRGFVHDLQAFNLNFHNPNIPSVAQQRMEHALAYVTSGFLLQVPPVFMRGIEIVKGLLRWDTVEKALAFALGNLPASSSPKPGVGSAEAEALPKHTHGMNSTRLMNGIADFLVYDFPTDFTLDTTVSQLTANPRLPTVTGSRPSTSNPRLGLIRFGEVPLEEISHPDCITRLLSAILLSLPFPQLKSVLKHHGLGRRLGWDKVGRVVHAVIEEREARRLKVSKSKRFLSNPTEPAGELWQNTQWEERIEPDSQHGSGLTIVRIWRGADVSDADESG